jgi:hypothetical protein
MSEIKEKKHYSGWNLIGAFIFIVLVVWIYNSYFRTDRPWWNGSKLVHLCAVNQTSNSLGCYESEVKSDGNKIVSIDLPIANEGFYTTNSSTCGKSEMDGVRYCDFNDSKGRNWEVKKL